MNFFQNVSLRDYSTMRLGGTAAYLVEVTSRQEILEALTWAQSQKLPAMMIGSGSNIVWRDEGFPGLIIVNKIQRFELFEEDETNVYLTAGAGEVWDSVVERSVEAGLTGIECLSLIPGTVGGTPVQNVGAYGQEISQTLVSVEAFDTQAKDFVNVPVMDCGFGYRTSRFKTTDHGRFFISAITLHLTKGNPEPPFYAALQAYLDQNNIHEYTPQTIRDAVIAIRSAKMPDPAVVSNNGSFFANPIIDEDAFSQLLADYPNIPHWPMAGGKVKVAAGWLVEQVGFKGVHDPETGMATWPKQALVLVNESAKNTADLLKFRQKILDTVQSKFGIALEQEPEILP
ncbi:MAG TPA: UDP-N-acetylmuramate dehydrogenase [Candidatus Saccharimonadales bacterium]|nr:UDP-N-acetylmuramate dehydrogenase [Candidatus Saccharimonadales bacterium]